VESEGVKRVVVVSDDIAKYDLQRGRFPAGTQFHDRSALDAVQRELREVPGVTVLIYEQTCAAEKRRRRKKGAAERRAAPSEAGIPHGGSIAAGDRGLTDSVDPPKRLFIHQAVCEGCGDCSVQSNCVAVLPLETPLGRKRQIDQTACNKDYSCAQGFCPSFVGVTGGTLRKRSGALSTGRAEFEARVAALPLPTPHDWTGPYDLLVTGVGGTGVVTVGAVIAMAAHLEGHAASVLDFMGFAQKGGAVLSFVRLADRPERLNQVRIDTQQADALLACDLVVGATPEALQAVRHGRTQVLANVHEVPVAESLRNPDADLHVDALLQKMRYVAGDAQVHTFDAQTLAQDFLGDTITSNIVAMGLAWQRGLVPVGLAALQQAIRLNNVAVESNLLAFSLGRLAAADPAGLQQLLGTSAPAAPQADDEPLEALIARGVAQLTAYQNAAWAQRYAGRVRAVAEREAALPGGDATLPLARAAARSLLKLMAYKDEYEVARLYSAPAFREALQAQFDGELQLEFHMAPPLLAKPRSGQPPKKMVMGPWLLTAMRWLAKAKVLRGGPLDVFGRTDERRMERALISDYEARLDALLQDLSAGRQTLATEIARVPLSMRGFGHVKLANVALAKAREAELLHRYNPQRYPRPAPAARAGQLKGIAVVAA
jgi:indolepyruvate ferredoxin oxidoreductase